MLYNFGSGKKSSTPGSSLKYATATNKLYHEITYTQNINIPQEIISRDNNYYNFITRFIYKYLKIISAQFKII